MSLPKEAKDIIRILHKFEPYEKSAILSSLLLGVFEREGVSADSAREHLKEMANLYEMKARK